MELQLKKCPSKFKYDGKSSVNWAALDPASDDSRQAPMSQMVIKLIMSS